MRTTLKRGIGRGAPVNGNGRAVFPPGILTPVRRYTQPPPPRRSGLQLLARFLGWSFAAVLLVAGALAGGAYLYFHESVAAVQAHTPAVKAAAKRLDVALPGHAAIALVVGYDRRANDPKGTPSRSDTIMLLRADPQTKTISLLSFPRDLWVDVRCPGRLAFGGRINTAYAYCGPAGTLETVKSLTGLPINYLITVDFHGFKEIVNKLHGVWIDVDQRYFNTHSGPTGYATINLRPGYQRLSGQQALDFVRYRHTDSDFYRLARQQAFVKSFKQQIAGSIKPTKLPGLISAITRNVEVGRGGGRQIDGKTVLSYALFAYGLPAGHFFQAKIQNPTSDSSFDVLASSEEIQAAVGDLVNPDVEAPRKATAAVLGRKLQRRAPKPSETTVTVLNGNGVPGSAGSASYALSQRGYELLEPSGGALANAPTQDYFHTKIYFDPRVKRSKAAALAAQTLFEPADVAKLPAPIRRLSPGSALMIVVGNTFHGEIAPASIDRTPRRQPAYVRYDPAASLDALREVRRRVPFRLELPAVIERNSRLDLEQPVRVYTMTEGHKGVRMVFRTGAREYWGIQQTDWEDAPVLADRSFRHVLGKKSKRTFDFYYSGPHLHMIVLRENGATYWVVNSLLDTLSNETMVAIAKGLKPLGKR